LDNPVSAMSLSPWWTKTPKPLLQLNSSMKLFTLATEHLSTGGLS
jgi:hypothetical protein